MLYSLNCWEPLHVYTNWPFITPWAYKWAYKLYIIINTYKLSLNRKDCTDTDAGNSISLCSCTGT